MERNFNGDGEEHKRDELLLCVLSCHAADADRFRSETRGVLASNKETFLSPSLPCLFAVHVGSSKLTVNSNCNCKYYVFCQNFCALFLAEI